jgi:hypothetical protein
MTKTMIFSAYFTSKFDKNRQMDISKDNYDYMSPLYESAVKLGLNLTIFYDDLSESFVRKWETDKIRFIKVSYENNPHDARFIILNDYLKTNHFDYLFMTDLRDVYINKNPFEIFNNNRESILCIQEDVDETIKENKWANDTFNKICNVDKIEETLLSPFVNERLMNCGIIGGDYRTFINFISKIVKTMSEINPDEIRDMLVVNYVFYKWFSNYDEVIKGDRLHSPFTKNIISEDYYFSHK